MRQPMLDHPQQYKFEMDVPKSYYEIVEFFQSVEHFMDFHLTTENGNDNVFRYIFIDYKYKIIALTNIIDKGMLPIPKNVRHESMDMVHDVFQQIREADAKRRDLEIVFGGKMSADGDIREQIVKIQHNGDILWDGTRLPIEALAVLYMSMSFSLSGFSFTDGAFVQIGCTCGTRGQLEQIIKASLEKSGRELSDIDMMKGGKLLMKCQSGLFRDVRFKNTLVEPTRDSMVKQEMPRTMVPNEPRVIGRVEI